MFCDGRLDPIDLMAIDHCERRKKLEKIVAAARASNESVFDISDLCVQLKIKPTAAEFDWMMKQLRQL